MLETFFRAAAISSAMIEEDPCYHRYRSLSANKIHGFITSQYENQPVLFVDIILSMHSVGSLDLSLFIN